MFNEAVRSAAGGNENNAEALNNKILGAGVTTLRGAMIVMDIAESAGRTLDKIRADLGSVQGQMQATVNNITITQVNVKAAESQIREVDFASESAEFNKFSIRRTKRKLRDEPSKRCTAKYLATAFLSAYAFGLGAYALRLKRGSFTSFSLSLNSK